MDSLCSNMEQYVDDCSAAGGSPNNWWKDRPQCKPGMYIDVFETLEGINNKKGCLQILHFNNAQQIES